MASLPPPLAAPTRPLSHRLPWGGVVRDMSDRLAVPQVPNLGRLMPYASQSSESESSNPFQMGSLVLFLGPVSPTFRRALPLLFGCSASRRLRAKKATLFEGS